MENEYVKKMNEQRYVREWTLTLGKESFKKVEKFAEALIPMKCVDFSFGRGPSSVLLKIYPRNRSLSVFETSFVARTDGVTVNIIDVTNGGFTASDEGKVCRYLNIPLDPKAMDKVLSVLVDSDIFNFAVDQCRDLEDSSTEGYMSFKSLPQRVIVSTPASVLEQLRRSHNEAVYFDLPVYSSIKRFDIDPEKLVEFSTEYFTVTKHEDRQFMTVIGDTVRINGLVTVNEHFRIRGLST